MKSLSILLLPALGAVCASSLQAGIVYDAVDDFSSTVNTETSTWSYRFTTDQVFDGIYDLLPSFTVNSATWDPDIGAWENLAASVVPGVGVNDTGAPVTFTGNTNTFYWPDDTIWMHPGSNALAIVSWLAPSSGLYDLNFSFADMDANGGDGFGFRVQIDTASPYLGADIANGGSYNYSGTVSVTAGQRIHFIVSPPTTASTGHQFDSTAFTATLTAIPEPSALLGFLTAGSLGLLFLRRRR